MLNLVYIANIRLPTEKAHGLQIMKTCEALALLGVRLTLLVPRRFNKINENPFDFYLMKRCFTIKKIFLTNNFGPVISIYQL